MGFPLSGKEKGSNKYGFSFSFHLWIGGRVPRKQKNKGFEAAETREGGVPLGPDVSMTQLCHCRLFPCISRLLHAELRPAVCPH